MRGKKSCYFSYLKVHCFYIFQIRHGQSHSLTEMKEIYSSSRCENLFSLLVRKWASIMLFLCFYHLHQGMMIARKKRVAENCFRLFYEHANQTTAEAKIPDFFGHYRTCFHPKPGWVFTTNTSTVAVCIYFIKFYKVDC